MEKTIGDGREQVARVRSIISETRFLEGRVENGSTVYAEVPLNGGSAPAWLCGQRFQDRDLVSPTSFSHHDSPIAAGRSRSPSLLIPRVLCWCQKRNGTRMVLAVTRNSGLAAMKPPEPRPPNLRADGQQISR